MGHGEPSVEVPLIIDVSHEPALSQQTMMKTQPDIMYERASH
jgi:hypothetical protein